MVQVKTGGVTVTGVAEYEVPLPGEALLPGATPNVVARYPWLRPHYADDQGNLVLRIQALVVESQGRRIVVDTCVGNDKPRTNALFDRVQGPFLTNLIEAGIDRETVDVVICTHLHVDHVGWNTMLVDGHWVPTFPSARYLVVRDEFDHWSTEPSPDGDLLGDSVRPLFDAGLAELVSPDHRVTGEVTLLPTPGHTPGHVSVAITSGDERAVITGDVVHHPLQCAEPALATAFDHDKAHAERTRREFLGRWADDGVAVIGTHVAAPGAGGLVRVGDSYRLEPLTA